MTIHFEKANLNHKPIILNWLQEPHIQDSWDSSCEHVEDIEHFIDGRKGPSSYFNGVFDYWVGSRNGMPYTLIMTSNFEAWNRSSLSSMGKTITMDFIIGNLDYLGQGLAAPTLEEFMTFYRTVVDPSVAIFFTDPAVDDYRSQHICKKIGFRSRQTYVLTDGHFKGSVNIIMTKNIC